MAKDIAAKDSVELFVVGLVGREEGDFWSQKDCDRALQLYRGCGTLRKYIALAYVQNTPVHTAAERDRFDQGCVTNLQSDAEYVRDLAQAAEIEIEIFGPLSTNPDRLALALTKNQSRELQRLPTADLRREAWQAIQEVHGYGSGFMNETRHVVKGLLTRESLRSTQVDFSPDRPDPAKFIPEVMAALDTGDRRIIPEPGPDSVPAPIKQVQAQLATVRPQNRKIADAQPPAPIVVEEFPWSQVEEALETALTWAQNQAIDGEKKYKMDVADRLCEFAEVVRRS